MGGLILLIVSNLGPVVVQALHKVTKSVFVHVATSI